MTLPHRRDPRQILVKERRKRVIEEERSPRNLKKKKKKKLDNDKPWVRKPKIYLVNLSTFIRLSSQEEYCYNNYRNCSDGVSVNVLSISICR